MFFFGWILRWLVLLLINMWNNNTLIDTWFVLTHKKTMLFWITVYWMLLFVNVSPELYRLVCVSVSLFSCPTLNRYYVRWMIYLTLTPLPWCHDVFFVHYVFALYCNVCMFICTRLAPCYYYLFWLEYVFSCVLFVDDYVILNQCDLNFNFLKYDLDDLYGDVECSFDFIYFCTWFVLMIFMINTMYGHWLSTDDSLWFNLQFTSGHEFR